MYKIGVVTAHPDEDWHSKALVDVSNQTAAVEIVDPIDFSVTLNPLPEVQIAGRNSFYYDALILRGLNKNGDADFQFEVYRLLECMGVLVINRIEPILIALDKFQTSYKLAMAGLPTPITKVTQNLVDAINFLGEHNEVVVKPLYGSLGEDILRVSQNTRPWKQLKKMLSKYGAVYLQEYIPNPGRDIRAFVVGDKVAAAIYREVTPGAWKTNIHQGAIPRPTVLSAKLRDLSIKASKVIGLDYTGVDIIEGSDGPKVLEVNGTPFWSAVNSATGQNMAKEIIDLVISRLNNGGRRNQSENAALLKR